MKHLQRWEKPQHYMGASWPEYFSAGVGRSRDSDCLERSNFACMLAALGGETDRVIVVRESHWAVGWVEWVAIHESDTKALKAADEACERLQDYPVLDEEHLSGIETETANRVWKDCFDARERIAFLREYGWEDAHDFADLIGAVRGGWCLGHTSELAYG